MKKTLITVLIVSTAFQLFSQETAEEKRMQWFEDAKLGIFIHW